MKKLIAIIASIIMVTMCLTGCGGSTASVNPGWYNTEKAKGAEDKASAEMKELVDLMMDEEGFIDESAVVTEMSPVKQEIVNGDKKGENGKYGGYLLIGAEEGYRFAYKYNESNVNLELYRFGEANDTSKKVIADVKVKGEFVLGEENTSIKAYLSSDEQFLMIYQDSSTEKKNKNKMNSAVKMFEGYSAKEDKAEETTAETTEK